MRRLLLSLSLAALACAGAAADDKPNCNGVGLGSDGLRLARVVGREPRVNFIASRNEGDGFKDCPSANAICRRPGFVVPGDEVMVDEIDGPYICASYVSARGVPTEGWLPKAALAVDAKPAAPKPAEWAGTWKRTEAEIVLKAKGAEIAAEGEATWGSGDPQRVRNGAVHSGNFDGKARPRGNMLAIGEGYDGARSPSDDKGDFNCRVRLLRFGRYLVVADNNQCGGANVRFDGVYVRAAK